MIPLTPKQFGALGADPDLKIYSVQTLDAGKAYIVESQEAGKFKVPLGVAFLLLGMRGIARAKREREYTSSPGFKLLYKIDKTKDKDK